MELFGPAPRGVELGREYQEVEREPFLVLCGYGYARAGFIEDGGGFRIGARQCGAAIEAMIGEARAEGVEIIVAASEGCEEVGKMGDRCVGHLFELRDPWIEQIRAVDLECFVGAESGDDFCAEV